MKTTEIPSFEWIHLFSGFRTEDILVGPLVDFYFNILYAGHYVCKKTFAIRRICMNSFFLMLTTAGNGRLIYQGKTYALTPGSVMLIDTQIPHEYHALEDGWTFKYIHFQGGMSERYYNYIYSRMGAVYQISQDMVLMVEDQLDTILKETEKNVDIDYAVVSSHIYSILTQFLSNNNQNFNSEKTSNRLELALSYIIGNYNRKITTDEIAAAAYLSRSYLSELFKKTYGIGPHEYLIMYRLSQAMERLTNTNCSVAEIAEQTGFRDLFTFSRVFKQKLGITPTTYRNQIQNGEK